MKLSTILIVLLAFTSMATVMNAQSLSKETKKHLVKIPNGQMTVTVTHKFKLPSGSSARAKQCTTQIKKIENRINNIQSNGKLDAEVAEKKVDELKNRIVRLKVVRHKNILEGRIHKCSKSATKTIVVRRKKCNCNKKRLTKWSREVTTDYVKLRNLRRERKAVLVAKLTDLF